MDNKKRNEKKKTGREEERTDQGVVRSVGNGLKNAMDLAVFTGVCAGAGALAGAAAYFYKQALTPGKHDTRADKNPVEKEYAAGRRWMKEHPLREDVYIRADDALQLHASFIPAPDAAGSNNRWYAVCVHGYEDVSEKMGLYARVYRDQYRMNVLMPDLRGHGLSDGDYIGMGYDDRRDLLRWIDWILERDAEAKVILHGISMGAAAVLMTTGEKIPSQVVAAISDSSYTSAMEIFTAVYRAQKEAVIPPPVMVEAVRGIALVRAGYDIAKASPVEAVARSSTPTLFIHGQADRLVPPEMMPVLFKAAACPKAFLWIPEAGHVNSVCVDPETYWSKVERFLHARGMPLS